jgi:hypothetical protein
LGSRRIPGYLEKGNRSVSLPQVQVGGRLVLPPRRTDEDERVVLVVKVLGPGGSPPFVVEWDDGSRTILYPSTATIVLPAPGS